MQAIILAAGFGSRLKPLTDTVPKSLTEVNGTPLLINALSILEKKGIEETIIVVGHMRETVMQTVGCQFGSMRITYVDNPIYRSTNNVYSLYLAKNYVNDNVLLLECDLFYRDDLVDTIINSQADCNILVSDYNSDTMDGTVINVGEDNVAKALVIKKQQGAGFNYAGAKKTVNVYKFKKRFANDKLFPAIELYVKTQSVNSYYELVLGSLILYGNDDIRVVDIDSSRWAEIDDINDLRIAEQKFLER